MDGIFLPVKLTTHDLWNPRMPEVSHAIEITGNSKTVLAIAWGGLWGVGPVPASSNVSVCLPETRVRSQILTR
jgi:hypothetical protein